MGYSFKRQKRVTIVNAFQSILHDSKSGFLLKYG